MNETTKEMILVNDIRYDSVSILRSKEDIKVLGNIYENPELLDEKTH